MALPSFLSMKSWTSTCSGSPFWLPFIAAIAEIPEQFLLLRVHRDHRLATFLEGLHCCVNVLERRVPVWMITAFFRFAIALQAVPRRFEQWNHCARADGVSLSCQFVRQLRGALAGATERRLGIASCDGVDQLFQCGFQFVVRH